MKSKINPKSCDPKEVRLQNIIDMGLNFTSMMRLYRKNSKQTLEKKILSKLGDIFNAGDKVTFDKIHSDFCHWGVKNIYLAKNRGNDHASYGQIAKTFDVVLKVAIYYSHLPNRKKSNEISKWLNSAVDNKMMAMLKRKYRKKLCPWPVSIKHVKEDNYKGLQEMVRKFIQEEHDNKILPVQFDDIYWNFLNDKAWYRLSNFCNIPEV